MEPAVDEGGTVLPGSVGTPGSHLWARGTGDERRETESLRRLQRSRVLGCNV